MRIGIGGIFGLGRNQNDEQDVAFGIGIVPKVAFNSTKNGWLEDAGATRCSCERENCRRVVSSGSHLSKLNTLKRKAIARATQKIIVAMSVDVTSAYTCLYFCSCLANFMSPLSRFFSSLVKANAERKIGDCEL